VILVERINFFGEFIDLKRGNVASVGKVLIYSAYGDMEAVW
jgi:hypothetical protein